MVDRPAPPTERNRQAEIGDDILVRVAEIRQENHGGDVSFRDIAWLCDRVAELSAARATAEQLREALRDARQAMERADDALPVFSMAGVTHSILSDATYAIDRALAGGADDTTPAKED